MRGHRAQWQHLAMTNAEQQLASQLANKTQLTQRFEALQKALGLEKLPERLECFDISHSQGEAPWRLAWCLTTKARVKVTIATSALKASQQGMITPPCNKR